VKLWEEIIESQKTFVYSVITSSIVRRLLRPTLWNFALLKVVLKGFSQQMQGVQVEPGHICLLWLVSTYPHYAACGRFGSTGDVRWLHI